MVQSFSKNDHWKSFSKTTAVTDSKWFTARVVTKKLISNEIEVLVFEIKITCFLFSCCLYCSFCQQCKDLFSCYVPFVSANSYLFTSCVYQGVKNVRFSKNLVCFGFLKHPFRDSPFFALSPTTYEAAVWKESVELLLEDLLVAIDDPGCGK